MRSDVLNAIEALAPRLRDAAARADADRRPADDTVAIVAGDNVTSTTAATEAAYPPELVRARCRADASAAARHVTRALETLMYAHGSRGFADSSPLQRI